MLYPNEKRNLVKLQESANSASKYEGIYNNKIKLVDDVKRASVNNARKIFYNKINTDPKFKKDVIDTIKSTAYGYDADNLIKTNPKLFYNRFNQALATPAFQSKGIHKQFYSELNKKGYNAILDINDARYSGYKNIAKSPTIFFGKDKWEKIGSTKLSETKIDTNFKKHYAGVLGKYFGKLIVGGVAINATLQRINNMKAIKKYLNEHPNSELSEKEILKIVKKQKKHA